MKIRPSAFSDPAREKVSILELSGISSRITLKIQSRLHRRERRQIALSFLRQIKPWLQYFRNSRIVHLDDSRVDIFRDDEPRLFQTRSIVDSEGELGFRIRMYRLKAGLSQKCLASRAEMSWSHLSEIERGLCKARKATLQRLALALDVDLEQNRKP